MIPIKKVKQIREELNLTHLVLYGTSEDGKHHVCTHGKSSKDSNEAADYGNNLKKHLGWPDEFCQSKPLERKCENCSFWKRTQIDHSSRIPENWPGQCLFEPNKVNRYDNDIACNHFDPNR